MLSTAIFIAAFSAITAETINYDDYKLYKVQPFSEEQAEAVRFFENNSGFDFWTDTRHESDIMVAPAEQGLFEQFLKDNEIHYSVPMENVRDYIKKEEAERAFENPTSRITFDKYYRHDEINNYLKDLAKSNPKTVSLELVGKSYENRDMIAIKISSGGNGSKPIILIDGGIHAREWISPATALYIIDQLVLNQTNSNLYKDVDWYILPVLNPDGYEYTHLKERLWRKTRSPGKNCTGTDANRNFYYHWGELGTSSDECSNVYRGPHAFSEKETHAIGTFGRKYAKNTKLYLTLHSYGQLMLYPWGYTNSSASNGAELQTLGQSVADAIKKVNGTAYKVGYSYHAIYPNSGSSMDWFRGVLNIPLAYTVELPDHGYGFVLPPSHIRGVVVETFEGVKVYAKYVAKKFSAA